MTLQSAHLRFERNWHLMRFQLSRWCILHRFSRGFLWKGLISLIFVINFVLVSLCVGESAKVLIKIEASNGNTHKGLVGLISMRELLHASDNSRVSKSWRLNIINNDARYQNKCSSCKPSIWILFSLLSCLFCIKWPNKLIKWMTQMIQWMHRSQCTLSISTSACHLVWESNNCCWQLKSSSCSSFFRVISLASCTYVRYTCTCTCTESMYWWVRYVWSIIAVVFLSVRCYVIIIDATSLK